MSKSRSKDSTLATQSSVSQNQSNDSFPINRIDHIRFYVGNAKMASYYYQHVFGFNIIAYSGLETGNREEVSYLLKQGNIHMLLSSPLTANHFYLQKLALHGDGIQDIALDVDDVDYSFKTAVERGAEPFQEPRTLSDADGQVRIASIKTYGDTIHTFINRQDYNGIFLPNFKKLNRPGKSTGLKEVDHIVGNVELGAMNKWVKFYEKVFGFTQIVSFDDKDISTEYTALMSKVMSNGNGRIKFPINEPAEGKKKSQVEEFLDFYNGAGAQHIALETKNIIKTVKELRKRGLQFLRVPKNYYDALPSRVGKIDENIKELAELGILVDRDDEGYLLQIFSKPISDRPTYFYEIIERKGAKSFGKGNFKALFEAIEREQELRGTL